MGFYYNKQPGLYYDQGFYYNQQQQKWFYYNQQPGWGLGF